MKFCTQCGASNHDESRFCVNCGQPLDAIEDTTESSVIQPLDQNAQSSHSDPQPIDASQHPLPEESVTLPLAAISDPLPTNAHVDEPSSEPTTSRSINRPTIIAASLIVVAILIGAGTVISYNLGMWGSPASGNGSDLSSDEGQPSQTQTDSGNDDSAATSNASPSEAVPAQLDHAALDAIVDADSTTNAAVGV